MPPISYSDPGPEPYDSPVVRTATIQLAVKSRAEWLLSNPVLRPGQVAIEEDTDCAKRGDGVTAYADLDYWLLPASLLYGCVSVHVSGKPKASETLVVPIVASTNEFLLRTDPAGLVGKSNVAATSSTAVAVRKNGVSIATLTWAAGSKNAVTSITGVTSFVAGDVLTIRFGPTPDLTLADIGITIGGPRTFV